MKNAAYAQKFKDGFQILEENYETHDSMQQHLNWIAFIIEVLKAQRQDWLKQLASELESFKSIFKKYKEDCDENYGRDSDYQIETPHLIFEAEEFEKQLKIYESQLNQLIDEADLLGQNQQEIQFFQKIKKLSKGFQNLKSKENSIIMRQILDQPQALD